MARMIPKSRLGKAAAAGGAIVALTVALVGGFEGKRTKAYEDIVGVPTICFGETRGVKMGDRATDAECDAMLLAGLVEFSAGVDGCLRNEASLPDETYVAFVSFAYNVGIGAFCNSTALKKANAGDVRAACDELLKWDRAGGKRVRGLTLRRQEERRLCLDGLKAAA